jgi:phosphoribosylanthranilate isomerase
VDATSSEPRRRRSGTGNNRELAGRDRRSLDIDVERSGGIARRRVARAQRWTTGCRRVNIGTAALEQPEWCATAIAEHGDRIAIGLDVRGRTLAARGWTREGGDLYDVLARLDAEGCARYVVTDVNKDGMLQGPNLAAAARRVRRDRPPVVASGGITELADLSALMELVDEGVEGAIVGTALYEGRFTLEDALALTWPDAGAMTLAVRVIPCLDVDAGRVVKGVNFRSSATPVTRSSWPGSTTRRAPTSSRSSTSPLRTRGATPRSTSCRARRSRCSSR